MTIYRLNL